MCIVHAGHSIAVLQEEGLFADSATSYLRYRDGVDFGGSEGAHDVTVCVRFAANYLRGQNSHFVSYANDDDTNAYLVYLKVSRGYFWTHFFGGFFWPLHSSRQCHRRSQKRIQGSSQKFGVLELVSFEMFVLF